MRRAFKIVGAILLVPIVGFLGLVVWITVFQLPADSPRVVETDDYQFTAPDNWITTCTDQVAGCLAVDTGPNDRLWSSRRYWIETQEVDANGVEDSDAFSQRAVEVTAALVRADGGDPGELVRVDESPVAFEGTWNYDVEDTTAARFSRSRFVRFAAGNIIRFTCYGEIAATPQEHDDTCFAALEGLHYPQAAAIAAAEEQRAALEREQQQQAEQARAELARAEQLRAQQTAQRADAVATEAATDDALNQIQAAENAIRASVEERRAAGRAQRQQLAGAKERFVEAAVNAARLTRAGVNAATGSFGLEIPAAEKRAAEDAIAAASGLSVQPADDAAMDVLRAAFEIPQKCELQVSYARLQATLGTGKPDPVDAACAVDALRRASLELLTKVDDYLGVPAAR